MTEARIIGRDKRSSAARPAFPGTMTALLCAISSLLVTALVQVAACGSLFHRRDSGLGGAAILVATAAGRADSANEFAIDDDGNAAFNRDRSR